MILFVQFVKLSQLIPILTINRQVQFHVYGNFDALYRLNYKRQEFCAII